MSKLIPQLTLVTNKNDCSLDKYLRFIETCAKAGIDSVQLREKNSSYEELLVFGKELKYILKEYNTPLIINDNIYLAQDLDADGVHLGQTDGDILTARNILGTHKIIGLSVDSVKQLYSANNLPIDYLGVGSIFSTASKKDIANILGCDGLKELVSIAKKPIIAIGGINEFNLKQVLATNVKAVAIIGALHNSKDPTNTIKLFKKLMQE